MLSLYLVSELGNEDFLFNVELSDDEDLADSYNLIEEDKAIILKRQRTSDPEKCRASEITYDIAELKVPHVNFQFFRVYICPLWIKHFVWVLLSEDPI